MKKIFYTGAIPPETMSESLKAHSHKTEIGAHSFFLGQVRADVINGKRVSHIEYTAHEEMAETKMHEIREAAFSEHKLTCLHVLHSLGRVPAGGVCLYVFVSSTHRKDATLACQQIVERIKTELPIWGKEIFEDQTHRWKENTAFL